jgi:uncharacterized membrane protein YvlD (DUF360 family)
MKKFLIPAIVGIVLLLILNTMIALLKVQGATAYLIIAAIVYLTVKYTYRYFRNKESVPFNDN